MKTYPPVSNQVRNRHTPRIIALGVLVTLLLCALAHGGPQTTDKGGVNPAGVYKLVNVAGKTVPCTINHEGTAMLVQSGSFTITTNAQITSVMTISVGDRKDMRIERHATYTQKGAELTMKWEGFGMTQGRVAGQTFTMTNEGMAYVYKK
jgi:hypothetical protein